MANYSVQEFIADDIIIDGDDLVVDGKTLPIKQKLVFSGLNYRRDISRLIYKQSGLPFIPQSGAGNSTTITVYAMLFHRNEDGTYGERVKGGYIQEYELPLIANQTTWVDAQIGIVVGNVGDELVAENVQPALYDEAGNIVQQAGKLHGKTLMREGQFYDAIAQGQQVNICDLIRQSMILNKHRCQPRQNGF